MSHLQEAEETLLLFKQEKSEVEAEAEELRFKMRALSQELQHLQIQRLGDTAATVPRTTASCRDRSTSMEQSAAVKIDSVASTSGESGAGSAVLERARRAGQDITAREAQLHASHLTLIDNLRCTHAHDQLHLLPRFKCPTLLCCVAFILNFLLQLFP